MPKAEDTIELKLPEQAVAAVLRSVLQVHDYRVLSSDLGILTASRVETGQVFRARKNVRFEVIAHWRAENNGQSDTSSLSEEDWPKLQLAISVSESQNTWTQGKCAEQLRSILKKVPEQVEALKRKLSELSKDSRYGSARWATFSDLQERTYLTKQLAADSLVVGQYTHRDSTCYVSVPKRETERHALICGPTGCGKTQSIFVPNLMERLDASAIVTEATPAGQMPDLLKLTAGYRHKHGHAIYYFNPADARSHLINPIDAVETVSDAQDLADIIIRNTTTNKHIGDQVWETSERQLLTALIMKAATEGGTLADVRAALTKGRKQLKATIEQAPASKGRDEALALFALSTEGFLNGVMVGLLVRLGPWLNPTVVALTGKTTVDLQSLQDDLFTFYLCVPSGARQLKPVAAMILNFLLDRVLDQLKNSPTLKRPMMMLLDELTNFGYIPDLSTQLTIMRHAHIPMVLGMQDVEQLRNVYGLSDAKIIFSQPATRVFFKPNEINTAREISSQLGQGTGIDINNMSLYPRKLLAPEEVLALDDKQAICFLPTGPAAKITKIKPGSYEHLELAPPLPPPVAVDESLVQTPVESEAEDAAKAHYPELFEEPSEHEYSRIQGKQNEQLDQNLGNFKRRRSEQIFKNLEKNSDTVRDDDKVE